MSVSVTNRLLAIMIGFFAACPEAYACDQALSSLIKNQIEPTIRDLHCPWPDKNYHISHLCYTPGTSESSIELKLYMKCENSDASLIRVILEAEVYGKVNVRNADCAIVSHELRARPETAKLAITIAELFNTVRPSLQGALNSICHK